MKSALFVTVTTTPPSPPVVSPFTVANPLAPQARETRATATTMHLMFKTWRACSRSAQTKESPHAVRKLDKLIRAVHLKDPIRDSYPAHGVVKIARGLQCKANGVVSGPTH